MNVNLFYTYKSPHACWDPDMHRRRSEFLKRIDPDYFNLPARALRNYLDKDDEDRHRAAIQIRYSYAHALETLLALTGAAIQAPDCVYAWMLRYKISELRSLIKDITEYKPVPKRIGTTIVFTWDELSKLICSGIDPKSENRTLAEDGFGRLWRHLAQDFIEDTSQREYNSIKHGLRHRPGGFQLYIRPESAPVDTPPISFGGSDFGSSFYVVDSLGDSVNFQIAEHSANWLPESIILATELVVVAMKNLIMYLRHVNGDIEGGYKILVPERQFYDMPWFKQPCTTKMSFNRNIRVQRNHLFTSQDVSDSYVTDSEQREA